MDAVVARETASTIPPGFEIYLPEDPSTRREAQLSSKWPRGRRALKCEMDGKASRGVWITLNRPKDKTADLWAGKDGQK